MACHPEQACSRVSPDVRLQTTDGAQTSPCAVLTSPGYWVNKARAKNSTGYQTVVGRTSVVVSSLAKTSARASTCLELDAIVPYLKDTRPNPVSPKAKKIYKSMFKVSNARDKRRKGRGGHDRDQWQTRRRRLRLRATVNDAATPKLVGELVGH